MEAYDADGFFKSTDGGLNWFSIESVEVKHAEHLTLHPVSPQILFASRGGVYRSLDGGMSWHPANAGLPDSGGVTALAINPGDPQVVYAGVRESITSSSNAYTLFRALDGGDSWEEVSPLKYRISQIVADPSDSDTLYVACGSGPKVLYRTLDGGVTWTTHNPPGSPGLTQIALDPNDPSTLLAVTGDLRKSRDRGNHWESFATPAGLQSLVFDLSSDVWYAATSFAPTGLYRSQDAGESWMPFGEEVHGRSIGQIAVGPEGTSSLFALGRYDFYRSFDGGESWGPLERFLAPFGDPQSVTALTVDDLKPSLYAGIAGGEGTGSGDSKVLVSLDEGDTWQDLGLIMEPWEYPKNILVSPRNPLTLYVVTENLPSVLLYRSLDGGETWDFALDAGGLGRVSAVIDPESPSTLYAVIESEEFDVTGVLKSVDSGSTWVYRIDGLPVDSHGFTIPPLALTIDPVHTDNLLGGRRRAIYKTMDGAGLWWRVDRNWPEEVSAGGQLLIDPLVPSTIYAATRDAGVLRSEDGGVTWAEFNESLNTLNVQSLDLDAPRRLLYAGTQTGVHVRPLQQSFALFADPNPIRVCDGATRSTWILWDAPGVLRTEIRVGTEDGPLFAAGRDKGAKATGNWVREGMQFFLLERGSGEVLAQTKARLTDSGCETFSAEPNSIPVCEGSVGVTTLSWFIATAGGVEIRVGSPTGKLMARGGPTGSAETGKWVTDGMQFFLLDRETEEVLGELEIRHTQEGCSN